VAHSRAMMGDALFRLVRAWLLTAVVDGLFSSALVVFAYHSTFTRLWQGVAAVLLGPAAFQAGSRAVVIGLLLHFAVALGWSGLFLGIYVSSARLRQALASSIGVMAAAAVYGPAIWLVMSLGVIALFTGRPPAFTFRWWVQLVGHIPFVALPIVATIRHPSVGPERDADRLAVSAAISRKQ
jgi:hypothetical protein